MIYLIIAAIALFPVQFYFQQKLHSQLTLEQQSNSQVILGYFGAMVTTMVIGLILGNLS
jgi:hypothetical protein